MTRSLVVLAATTLAALVAAPAHAGYFLTAREAESITRQHLKFKMGYDWTRAYCRPQFKGDGARRDGYAYHRWTCGWIAGFGSASDGEDCGGVYRIRGSRDEDAYYARALYKDGVDCI